MLMTGSREWLHFQSSSVLRCLQLMSVLLSLRLYMMIQIFIAKVVSGQNTVLGLQRYTLLRQYTQVAFFPKGFWPWDEVILYCTKTHPSHAAQRAEKKQGVKLWSREEMSWNECKKHCFQSAKHVITNLNKSSLSQQGVDCMPCLSG